MTSNHHPYTNSSSHTTSTSQSQSTSPNSHPSSISDTNLEPFGYTETLLLNETSNGTGTGWHFKKYQPLEISEVPCSWQINLTQARPWRMNLVASYKESFFVAVNDTIEFFRVPSPQLPQTEELVDMDEIKPYHVVRIPQAFHNNRPNVTTSENTTINALKVGLIGIEPSLVAVNDQGLVVVWFLRTLTSPLLFDNEASTWGIALHSSRRLIAVSANNHLITIFDLTSGAKHRLSGHSHNIPCVDFNSEGDRLTSCSVDGTVRVWNVNTSLCIAAFKLDDGYVWSSTFLYQKHFLPIQHDNVSPDVSFFPSNQTSFRLYRESIIPDQSISQDDSPNRFRRQGLDDTPVPSPQSQTLSSIVEDLYRNTETGGDELDSDPFNSFYFHQEDLSSLSDQPEQPGQSSSDIPRSTENENFVASLYENSSPELNRFQVSSVTDPHSFQVPVHPDLSGEPCHQINVSKAPSTCSGSQRSSHRILISTAKTVFLVTLIESHSTKECLFSVKQIIKSAVPDLRADSMIDAFDRINMVSVIPSFSLVLMASQKGRMSLTRLIELDGAPSLKRESILPSRDAVLPVPLLGYFVVDAGGGSGQATLYMLYYDGSLVQMSINNGKLNPLASICDKICL